ncbi:MAG: sigma-54-dependent Fis family transcriptional regulator [Betaproteobacteria bacterium]|nr:sigma-54-dependent Fis family transcriptional regulator [Betaproteobacteria bacterium]
MIIVDDDPLIRESLQFLLASEFRVAAYDTRANAVAWLRQSGVQPDLALIDLGLPPTPALPNEGFRLINDLLAHAPNIRILVLSGQNEESNARRARALGAVDLVPKPAPPDKLLGLLKRTLKISAGEQDARLLMGDSPPMLKLRSQIDLYAASTFPTLIEGESGSGKERVASALHQLSPRAQLPFLALNCAAISSTLVEPTLFGHAKGAFTGAATAKSGYFEDAGEGTLFLDEIGELPIDLQPKLLRVLENGEYQRVGETQTRKSRARIVAATNRDLKAEVKAGRFRADLYHRLSVFAVAVPPLRELGQDKLRLLEHYRAQFASHHGAAPFRLTADGEAAWLSYPFPGNIRELKNIVIRLVAKHAGYDVGDTELLAEFEPQAGTDASHDINADPTEAAKRRLLNEPNFSLDKAIAEQEQAYLDAALGLSEGNISKAARLLGLSRSTLYSRLEVSGRLPDRPGDKLAE